MTLFVPGRPCGWCRSAHRGGTDLGESAIECVSVGGYESLHAPQPQFDLGKVRLRRAQTLPRRELRGEFLRLVMITFPVGASAATTRFASSLVRAPSQPFGALSSVGTAFPHIPPRSVRPSRRTVTHDKESNPVGWEYNARQEQQAGQCGAACHPRLDAQVPCHPGAHANDLSVFPIKVKTT